MAQMFNPIPCQQQILCCYVNSTSTVQIARITNIPNWYFERVVFPSQRLLFESPLEAQLEIYTSVTPSGILLEKLLCKRLRVNEALTGA